MSFPQWGGFYFGEVLCYKAKLPRLGYKARLQGWATRLGYKARLQGCAADNGKSWATRLSYLGKARLQGCAADNEKSWATRLCS